MVSFALNHVLAIDIKIILYFTKMSKTSYKHKNFLIYCAWYIFCIGISLICAIRLNANESDIGLTHIFLLMAPLKYHVYLNIFRCPKHIQKQSNLDF